MLCAGFIDTLKASGGEAPARELEVEFEKVAAEFPPVLLKTVRTEIEKGELANALAMLGHAALDPNYRAEAFFQKGEIFLMTADFDRARAAFEEARRLNADFPPAEQQLPPQGQEVYASMRNMPNGPSKLNERNLP